MPLKILPIFSKGKEEKTLKAIQELMKNIQDVNEELRDCVKYWLDDDYDETEERIAKIEKLGKESDEINRGIDIHLFGGTFLPDTRMHLHDLGEALDDVVDLIMKTAQLFWYMKDKKFDEDIKGLYWKLSEQARNSVDKLLEILKDLLENDEKIMDHIQEAKELESECNEFKKEILETVYFGKKEAVTNTLLIQIASNMADIGSKVENACRHIAVLRLLKED